MFSASQYRRLAAIIIFLMVVLVCLLGRLFEVQVNRHRELQAKARRYTETSRIIEACRGSIRDRNGRIVARAVPTKVIFANLSLCSNRVEQIAQTCAPLLGIPADELANRLRNSVRGSVDGDPGRRKVLVLKRDVSVDEWRALSSALALESFGFRKGAVSPSENAELQKLRHKLLFARETQMRSYPYGETLAQTIGFVAPRTNSPGFGGVYGLERSLDKILSGENGVLTSLQDAGGNELPLHRTLYKLPVDGDNVVLTIDLRLQKIVEEALDGALTKYRPRGASAIVMNPRTFELLAVGSAPGFNPRNPGDFPHEDWRNPSFSDRVEPGSILKMITLAAALDLGISTLDSGVYCEKGRYVFNRVVVHDHVRHGLLNLRQAFAKSSNIAFAKTALELGPQRLYSYLTNFGLGRTTGLPVVGETSGLLGAPSDWSTMRLTRAGFGQGICVSQLQMAVATCVIANEGRLMRPLLVSRIESPQGRVLRQFQPQFIRSVVRPQTAQLVKEAMKAVVAPGGTATLAAMENYTVAAKTGTAQKSTAQGYLPDRYYSSVIGFFPADAPQIVIAVALDEPQNGYYGGIVVAPVFRTIAEQIAQCLSIPPDKAKRAPARIPPTQPNLPQIRPETLVRGVSRGQPSLPRQTFASAPRP